MFSEELERLKVEAKRLGYRLFPEGSAFLRSGRSAKGVDSVRVKVRKSRSVGSFLYDIADIHPSTTIVRLHREDDTYVLKSDGSAVSGPITFTCAIPADPFGPPIVPDIDVFLLSFKTSKVEELDWYIDAIELCGHSVHAGLWTVESVQAAYTGLGRLQNRS